MPLILSGVLLVLDQITKAVVVAKIPVGTIYRKFFGDFLWIVHVRNTGAAFSIGAESGVFARVLMFLVVPAALMGLIAWCVTTSRKLLTRPQRWFAAGILGGGLGTICDRIFRFDEGVVDFISVKFYGLFGLERWPTFNVSDSCVVVFVILLAISIIFEKKDRNNE